MTSEIKQSISPPAQVSADIFAPQIWDTKVTITGRFEFTLSEVATSSNVTEIKKYELRGIERIEKTASLMQYLVNQRADELELIANALEQALKPLSSLEDEEELANKLSDDRQFSKWERLAVEFSSLAQYLKQKRVLLDGALTASQVADQLAKDVQIIDEMLKNSHLLAVTDGEELLFPVCQFDSESPDGVIVGLPDVLKALNVEPLAKLSWLMRPNPFLDNLTPIDALKQGQIERVIGEARGVEVI
ncbi:MULTISPECIES: hypothetical protein [Aerosakkonema]|uniref:hypothetical protein n=1 Tax=Aerosakkonema TaxID=1246629 RepID=UPI0035BA34D7